MKKKDSPLWDRLPCQLFEILGVKGPSALRAVETGNVFAFSNPNSFFALPVFYRFQDLFFSFLNEYLWILFPSFNNRL